MSPYTFFWQASEQAEEDVAKRKIMEISGKDKPRISKSEFNLMRIDVTIGMALSQLIMWSVITTTAGSLVV